MRETAFWAWTVSIAFHLVVLSLLGVARFSRAESPDQQHRAPNARIERIRRLANTSPVTAVPKVAQPPAVIARNRYASAHTKAVPLDRIFSFAKPGLRDWPADDGQAGAGLPNDIQASRGIEFFTTASGQRKVCYLVDCSGSMQGIFTQVRERLKESIAALQPDQYFYLIFFGDDKLYEIGQGKLLRATPEAKLSAAGFVDSIRPAGRTNAVAALERVVQIRDSRGMSPALVYFLTDGFELTGRDATAFPLRIAGLLKQSAPQMKINTIAFLPNDNDRKMLETIARQSGGEFFCIGAGK